MPEEVTPENKETKTEVKIEVASAMIHSYYRDVKAISGDIVANDAVPDAEAIMLADIQSTSNKRRETSFFRVTAILIILTAILIFVLPKFFSNTTPVNNPVVKDKKIMNADIKYILELPASADLEDFRKKVFTSSSTISEFSIQSLGKTLDFKSISPLLNERFIKNMEAITNGEYLYGLYTANNVSHPFFVMNVTDRDQAEKILLTEERTLYNDFSIALQLPDDFQNETRHFENFISVRNPLRELKDVNNETVLVYGFATDDIVVFAPSREVYNAVRERVITGY